MSDTNSTSDPRFHLGWFMNFMAPGSWRGNWGGSDGENWADGEFYVDFLKSLERACFDYMMIEDSSMVPDAYGGTTEVELKQSLYAPKHDPVMLVPLLARATSRIGIVATMSTSFYPPFLLARAMSTLDHITHGRVGWNIVTSSEHRAAQNYGMDQLWEHDERYERADEFVDVVEALWSSWEPDAMVMDRETGRYVDHTKVKPIDFKGRYFSVRGPLNTLPSPQGRPVYCQAGGSPRGREFAARHADTIITASAGIESMKEYRNDVRRRMETYGRDPDSCKLLFVISPILADTVADAERTLERMREATDWNAERALAHLSALTENDFSQFDLDAPVPRLTTNGHRSTLADFLKQGGGGKTLREAAAGWNINAVDLVGTPETVAERMGEVMAEVGGDGFLISGMLSRQYIGQITEGLVPALQRRGLVRTEYTYPHFRDNLMEF
jgi:FMN-dependent oxidoreductase (nitrilotriacetate monooxygenase family)